ncbi:hypothetical protein [Microbacterium sp. 179-I 3D4 NHS]|uniref:hypothetical protein n=1 Tax=Microbacterium sp. 179-I 3D4 NHS TaxID=3142381 RepID=UPI0039A113E6
MAIVALLGFAGCRPQATDGLRADEAREQLDEVVEAVQTTTGKNWEVDVEPGVIGCSATHGQWHTA